MIVFYVILSVWIISGCLVFAGGLTYWQKEFPSIARQNLGDDKLHSFLFSLGGPFSLLVLLTTGSFKHGLKWWQT